MLRTSHAAFALIATTIPAAHAQQLPSAGTQLQQLPAAPEPVRPDADIDIRQPDAVAIDPNAGTSITVETLRVTGQTLYSEAELRAVSGFVPGNAYTFGQLRQLAAAITTYYRDRGYFLAQAYLPEQDVQSGNVTIAVAEGRYGKLDVRNSSRLSNAVPSAILEGLAPGDLVASAPLERRLLLLSDLPGIRVRGTLAPGAAVGTSDLIVDITPGRTISGSVEADNGGSRYTGMYRAGGAIHLNNPAGIGDQLSVRLLASDSGLGYGRIAYQAPVGPATLGIAFAHLRYDLGREFGALDGSGTANIASVYGSYPLMRSRRANLYALAGLDYKWLRDEIGLISSRSDKRVKAATLGLAGDFRDSIAGGGSSSFSLGWTSGHLDIKSRNDRVNDAATARSAGRYNKIQGSLARMQSVAGPMSLYGAVRGQWAFDNLDSSEKLDLGGADGVRAYPEGEAFGDSGYIAAIEARLQLNAGGEALPGRFELAAFVDTGEIRFAENPWFAGRNRAVRSGYGVGLNWYGPDGLSVRASYARKLGTGPATSAPDRNGRVWFQLVKLF